MSEKDCPAGSQWDALVNACVQSGPEINDGSRTETRAEAVTSGESQAQNRLHLTETWFTFLISFLELHPADSLFKPLLTCYYLTLKKGVLLLLLPMSTFS